MKDEGGRIKESGREILHPEYGLQNDNWERTGCRCQGFRFPASTRGNGMTGGGVNRGVTAGL